MFGGDMMEKLMAMQNQVELSKEKLEKITVTGEAGNNLVIVEMNGNRKLTNLSINIDLKMMDKEDLEDLLSVALNRAMEAAEAINKKEMEESARGFLPGF